MLRQRLVVFRADQDSRARVEAKCPHRAPIKMVNVATPRMQAQRPHAPTPADPAAALVTVPDGSEKSQLGALVLTCAARPFGEPCFRLGEPHRHDLHRFDRWHRNSTG